MKHLVMSEDEDRHQGNACPNPYLVLANLSPRNIFVIDNTFHDKIFAVSHYCMPITPYVV